MKHRIAVRAAQRFALVLFTMGLSVSAAWSQANVQGQWTTLALPMSINPVHVALLHTGKVLIVSGSGNVAGNNNFQAAIWDPQMNTLTTQPLAWDMFCNGMVFLPDGRLFINGGTQQYDPFHGHKKSAVFDPATGVFTDVENMAHGRWYPAVTVLGDGRVMTFSGVDENSGTNSAVEIYTAGSGWSQQYPAPWTPPLYPRMHLLPNGKVFYSGYTTSSHLFDPSNQTWSLNIAHTNYGGGRVYGGSVLLPLSPENGYDPKVMIMGGGSPSTATTEIIDMGAPTPAWQWGPNMSQPRIEMNAVILPNGKVLAMGGSFNDEDGSTASLNGDLYDPVSNLFTPASANLFPRLYHSVALLLPDATVWLAGGNPTRGFYQQQMEIYTPAYLFTTDINGNPIPATRPTIGGAPGSLGYGSSFSVQTPDAGNISSVALVRSGAPTHAFDMDQRMVKLSFTQGAGALTVTAPPNGNIAPPGYYMLFILNNAGVPSVANFVQLGLQTDFSVSATPPSQTVEQGESTSYAVNIVPTGGFGGDVTLAISGLPQDTSANFSPDVISGQSASTLNVSTLSTTPVGSYPLTITATSGSLVHTTTVTLAVNAPADFSITVTPPNRIVARGSSTQYKVTITGQNEFAGVVTMSVTGLPAKTRFLFNPLSLTGGGNSAFKVLAAPGATPGIYMLTVTATSGSLSHSATVGLKIQ